MKNKILKEIDYELTDSMRKNKIFYELFEKTFSINKKKLIYVSPIDDNFTFERNKKIKKNIDRVLTEINENEKDIFIIDKEEKDYCIHDLITDYTIEDQKFSNLENNIKDKNINKSNKSTDFNNKLVYDCNNFPDKFTKNYNKLKNELKQRAIDNINNPILNVNVYKPSIQNHRNYPPVKSSMKNYFTRNTNTKS